MTDNQQPETSEQRIARIKAEHDEIIGSLPSQEPEVVQPLEEPPSLALPQVHELFDRIDTPPPSEIRIAPPDIPSIEPVDLEEPEPIPPAGNREGRRSLVNEREARKAAGRYDRLHGRERDDTWTAETAKALDLSDAENAGFRDPEKNESRELEDFIDVARTHQQRTTELLRTMQEILIEAVSDIETLQSHFNRLR